MDPAGIKKQIGGFHSAPWLRNGRNMRGFIGKMILATTEEQDKLVEEEKGKNPVRCEREEKNAFLP